MSAGLGGPAVVVVRRDGEAWVADSPHALGYVCRAESYLELRGAVERTLPNAIDSPEGFEFVFSSDAAVALLSSLASWDQVHATNTGEHITDEQATRLIGGEDPTEVLGGG